MISEEFKKAKLFFKNWDNGDHILDFHHEQCKQIFLFNPKSIFDFGAGNGKVLNLYREKYMKGSCVFHGCEMAPDAAKKARTRGIDIIDGDESYLKTLKDKSFDVVITTSVLDHIPEPDFNEIILDLLRIGKCVIFLETQATTGPNPHYYNHDYESYGLIKIDGSWHGGDGNIYHIWRSKLNEKN